MQIPQVHPLYHPLMRADKHHSLLQVTLYSLASTPRASSPSQSPPISEFLFEYPSSVFDQFDLNTALRTKFERRLRERNNYNEIINDQLPVWLFYTPQWDLVGVLTFNTHAVLHSAKNASGTLPLHAT